jgi:hypothetical protein
LINKKKLPYNITRHKFISKIYFNYILKIIIKLILINKYKVIIDFGSGYGYLKKLLTQMYEEKKIKVINYDIIKELSEVRSYKNIKFECLVANQVFYLFDNKQLNKLLSYLKRTKPNLNLIVTISRQSLLNNIGKFLLNEKNAHKGTKLSPFEELKILQRHTLVKKKINVLFLSDIYLLKFINKN